MGFENDLMWAAQIVGPKQINIVEIPKPTPEAGQVRIRVLGCGVCASNLGVWQGLPWFEYPRTPGEGGHEAWGLVDAVGSGVSTLRVGDPVIGLTYHSYAQFDVARQEDLLEVPSQLRGEPLPAEAVACAINVFQRSRIAAGDTVAVVGFGFLGALLGQLAVNAGAKVLAIGRRRYALELAASMGATPVAMSDVSRTANAVREATDGELCQTVIEAVGHQEPLDLAGEITRERGTLVIAGYHQDGPRQVNMQQWNWRGIDVVNAHERQPAKYLSGMRNAVEAICKKELNINPLITHHYPLSQLSAALEHLAARPDGFLKGVIHP